MPVWTIVVAGGSGSRFGQPKQYRLLGPRRVLDWSLAVARRATDGVVLVVPLNDAERPEPGADHVVGGGATRSESVRAGLLAVPVDADVIVVHDAARPLAGIEIWERVLAAIAAGADASVPCVPVTDTLRRLGGGTVDREGLLAVQTPQAFRAGTLRAAHEGAPHGTDDASLVEAIGGRVVVVDGDPTNLKITRPVDLQVAEALWPR